MSTVKSVKIVDKLPSFSRHMKTTLDDAVAEAAKDVLINAKNRAPFAKGALRREADVKQSKMLTYIISFWVEYARFQEFGGNAKRRVRNYTTGGTGAHFLKSSGDEQVSKLAATVKKHALRIRV